MSHEPKCLTWEKKKKVTLTPNPNPKPNPNPILRVKTADIFITWLDLFDS